MLYVTMDVSSLMFSYVVVFFVNEMSIMRCGILCFLLSYMVIIK